MNNLTISTTELSRHIGSTLLEVVQQKRVVHITKNGKLIAKIIPSVEPSNISPLGCMKDTAQIHTHDLFSTDEEWYADE